jgi:hypothetical protein
MEDNLSANTEYAIETQNLDIYYGNFRAVKETSLQLLALPAAEKALYCAHLIA